MNLKLGILILLGSLAICASLTENKNSNETAIDTHPRKSRAVPPTATAVSFVINTKKDVDVINVVRGFMTGMDDVIEMFRDREDTNRKEFRNEVMEKLWEFFRKMADLNQRIKKLHNFVSYTTRHTIKRQARRQGYNVFRQEFHDHLNYIEQTYKDKIAQIIPDPFYTLTEKIGNTSSILLNGIMEGTLFHIKSSAELHGKMYNGGTNDLFEDAINVLQDQKRKYSECNDFSAYDKLFFYYEYIVKTVTQGYNILQLVYQHRKLRDNNIDRDLPITLQRQHKEAVIKITETAQHYLRSVDNANWRSAYACDPERWEEGVNYLRIQRFKIPPCDGDPTCGSSEIPSILSLMMVSCNTSNYEVVTNARFYEKDGIIGVEPQCGVFVDGQVDVETLRWNTWNRDHYSRDNPPPKHKELGFLVGSFHLDDIVLPEGEFLTAVGFKHVYRGRHEYQRVSIAAQGTKFYDFKGKETDIGKTFDRDPYREYKKLKPVSSPEDIYKYYPATTRREPTYEMSEPGKSFVNIFYAFNSTVIHNSLQMMPYLDTNEYKPPQILPLGGIGLMYKSIPKHLGFLALKFFSTQFTSQILENYAERLNLGTP